MDAVNIAATKFSVGLGDENRQESAGWLRGVVVCGVRRMNEVNPCRPRLVLGRVTNRYDTIRYDTIHRGRWIAEWLACRTQAQSGLGSNRSRDAVG